MALWGIDLGGTKVEGVVLKSADSPEVIVRERMPSEVEKGYDHILKRISELIEILKGKTGLNPDAIGMGTPGSIDPSTGLLKNSNSVALNGMPFLADIQKELGVSVKIANDANCFALAETRMGVVKEVMPDASVVFGVIMGTGVGGGIVIDNKVMNGHQGIGGEWGHNFLHESGGLCYCGKTGCVETVLSGPGLEKYYRSLSGTNKNLREIVKLHSSGEDRFANQTMERLFHYFGLGISNIINILDPDIIVIGGGVGNIDLLYSEGVEKVSEFVFNPTFNTRIVKPTLGDSAGVFGAAFLVA